MRLGIGITSILAVVVACSTPSTTILKHEDPSKENWQSTWDKIKPEFEISTIKKGITIKTRLVDIEIGKLTKGIRYNDPFRLDYANPTKKIWGVRFVKYFYEPYVWKDGHLSQPGKVRP